MIVAQTHTPDAAGWYRYDSVGIRMTRTHQDGRVSELHVASNLEIRNALVPRMLHHISLRSDFTRRRFDPSKSREVLCHRIRLKLSSR